MPHLYIMMAVVFVIVTAVATHAKGRNSLGWFFEQEVAASEAQHAQRWHKFEEQLNQKDRDLLQARAAIDELKHLKEQAEAHVGWLEGSRAAIARLRSAVQSVRDRRPGDSET